MRRHDGITRRELLGRAIGIGVVSTISGLSAAAPQAIAASASASGPQVIPPALTVDPKAKRGGIFRNGLITNPAHYDMHQSGTNANYRIQAAMYNGLLRYDPRDGGRTIIQDLAVGWSVSADQLQYTFYLRDGVKFHDGTPFTAADVVATFQRIIWPPSHVVSIRQPLFKPVTKVEALDPKTVRFTLKQPYPIFIPVVASGWNIIVSKKSLEANNQDLRKVPNYPGTGPFRHVKLVPGEIWVLERNPDYWNKGLPYLDGIQHIHLAGAAAGAAVLAGRADFAFVEPDAAAEARKRSDVQTGFNQGLGTNGVFVNLSKEPWSNVKVRRAIHLAWNRHHTLDIVKAVRPFTMGRITPTNGEWAIPYDDLIKMPGYRPDNAEDVKAAKKLMAEAGYASGIQNVDLLLRDLAPVKAMGESFAEQMRRVLNITVKIRLVPTAVWFEEAKKRTFDFAAGGYYWPIDTPEAAFSAIVRCDSGENYGRYCSAEANKLLDQIYLEANKQKRWDLTRRLEKLIVDDDVGYIPWAIDRIDEAWRSYVKGHFPDNFGWYRADRWDQVWLDK